jgi:hypothetical protein
LHGDQSHVCTGRQAGKLTPVTSVGAALADAGSKHFIGCIASAQADSVHFIGCIASATFSEPDVIGDI